MASQTHQSISSVRILERIVKVHRGRGTASIPHLGPEPPVKRCFRVFDHDGPVVRASQILLDNTVKARCRNWRKLLLDDPRAIGNPPLAPVHKPVRHLRRVVDMHRWMYYRCHALDQGPRIAHRLVAAPAQIAILERIEIRQQLFLYCYWFAWRDESRELQLLWHRLCFRTGIFHTLRLRSNGQQNREENTQYAHHFISPEN